MKTFTKGSYRFLIGRADSDSTPDRLTRKLRSFETLPVGWSHGEGRPVGRQAIRVAEEFVKIATLLQLRADVFPGLHGDCAVAFYHDQRCVEIVVDPTHPTSFGLHVEEGVGFQFATIESKENASHPEVVDQIVQLLPDAWKSPVSSASGSLMGRSADFRTLFSSTLQGRLTLAPLMGS